jgi:4-azaleucine resistance transporter AzlC
MQDKKQITRAFLAAVPHTMPIFAGFVFLGLAYGIYMNALGFSPIYPILMSLFIFSGSMEFLAANLLFGSFDPLNAFVLALMVNARHVFYGISMLDKYKNTGKKKPYLIFGLCDESFAINYTSSIPHDVDKGWFMFFITLLNHSYWVFGAAIGAIFGSYINFNSKGISFILTSLVIVLFIEQWIRDGRSLSALTGLSVSIICLLIFGSESFMLPAMITILGTLSFFRKPMQVQGATA